MFPQVTFNYPFLAFFAALAVPLFLLLSRVITRYQGRFVHRFGRLEVLRQFTVFRPKFIAVGFFSLAIALAALAAAEPKIVSGDQMVSRTFNAVVVLDVSRSMMARDTPDGRTRLELGIAALEELFESYPDGRFGLVIYTKKTIGYQLTSDHEALLRLMKYQLDEANVRGEGSNLRIALEEAAKVVDDSPYPVEVVLIVSDGGISGSTTYNISLDKSVDELRFAGVRVATAGVGNILPARIPVYNEEGELIGYHTFRGSIATTSLREDVLKEIARSGRGSYQRIENEEALVEMVQSNLWDTQPIIQEEEINLTVYPTAGALILVFLLLLVRKRH